MVEVSPSDTIHNNLLNFVLVYDKCYEEEELSYGDSKSRLYDEIGDFFET